jgi:hypothetical protein
VTICSPTIGQYKGCYTLREVACVGTFLPDYMELEATTKDPSQNKDHRNPKSHNPDSVYHFHNDISYSRFFTPNKLINHFMKNFIQQMRSLM